MARHQDGERVLAMDWPVPHVRKEATVQFVKDEARPMLELCDGLEQWTPAAMLHPPQEVRMGLLRNG